MTNNNNGRCIVYTKIYLILYSFGSKMAGHMAGVFALGSNW